MHAHTWSLQGPKRFKVFKLVVTSARSWGQVEAVRWSYCPHLAHKEVGTWERRLVFLRGTIDGGRGGRGLQSHACHILVLYNVC